VAILLGLAVAAAWGAADFLGGLASRRVPSGAVTAGSQLAGLVAAAALALAAGTRWPAGPDVVRSMAAGAVGVTGLACLYRGLGSGRMSVVAPLSAVMSALIPLAWGLLHGERPSSLALVGVSFAVVAIALIASSASMEDPQVTQGGAGEIGLGLLAGAGFGGSVVLFAEASHGTGLWPVAIARAVAVVLVSGAVVARRGSLRIPRPARATVAAAGVLDATATVAILLAVRRGLLSLVGPVQALYPGVTVVLAWLVLGELLGRRRVAGLVIAVVGLAAIAAGQ